MPRHAFEHFLTRDCTPYVRESKFTQPLVTLFTSGIALRSVISLRNEDEKFSFDEI